MRKVKTRNDHNDPRHYIREWRKYRGLSQEALAEHLGVTHGAISQVERGITGYTQPMLEGMAEAMECTPADLIMRDPGSDAVDQSVFDGLSPELRKEALHFIEFLKGTNKNETGQTDE